MAGPGSSPAGSGKKTLGTKTDAELKESGNQFFASRKYAEAFRCYSEAIQLNPSNPIYYTNRALVALRMHEFQSAISDSRAALDLDPTHLKGFFYLGQALCEIEHMDDGIHYLQRAVDIAREQRLNFGDELTQVLRHWRKCRFSIKEDKRLLDEIELQKYLKELVIKDHGGQLKEVNSGGAESKRNAEVVESKLQNIEDSLDEKLSAINSLFAQVDDRRKKRDVPDFLCGKISFDILRDPVITPSGITYERKDIEDHLMRVGHFDPVTRVSLTSEQLIPNYAMKEVVDAFVADNEWALDL